MSPGIRETKFRFEQQAQGSQHPPLSEERSTPLSTAEPRFGLTLTCGFICRAAEI